MSTILHTRPSILVSALAILTQLSTFNPQPASAITFTNNTTITQGNVTYDGQDIVVDGARLTVNGPHAFNFILLTNQQFSFWRKPRQRGLSTSEVSVRS